MGLFLECCVNSSLKCCHLLAFFDRIANCLRWVIFIKLSFFDEQKFPDCPWIQQMQRRPNDVSTSQTFLARRKINYRH